MDPAEPLSATRLRLLRERGDLDANALELYARVVAAGSFAQAARQLGLTRAAVSRRIASIEDKVGQTLIARTTRSLGLTDAGRQLARQAQAVRDAAEAARLGLRRGEAAGDTLEGLLRVTTVPSFGQHVLLPLLQRFQQQHPGVQIELQFTDRRIDLLREGVDVAFRITRKPPPDWVAQPVLDFRIGAFSAPGPTLSEPADLAQTAVLLFGASAEPLPLQWRHADGRSQTVEVGASVAADSMDALLTLARDGAGIVLAPDYCVQSDLAAGRLVERLPGWHLPIAEGHQVQALTLPVATAGPKARALVRWVTQALKNPHGDHP